MDKGRRAEKNSLNPLDNRDIAWYNCINAYSTSREVELIYRIDNQSRQAVYEQIVLQVEQYVLTGVLKSGDKLPSVRRLSIELNVNPNTVQRAYTELERSEVLITAPGRGAFVSESGATLLKEKKRKMYLSDLRTLIAGLWLSGVDKEEIIEIIETQYEADREEEHD